MSTKTDNTLEILPPEKPGVKAGKALPDTHEKVEGLRTIATEALQAAQVALDAYWRLCVFIREKQLTPVTVNAVLKELGYGDVRISEIKRVSFSADKVFEDFRKKTIGFRLALKEARKVARKPRQIVAEEVLFSEALARVVEEFLPLKGKLPRWVKHFEYEAQGSLVTFTAKRLENHTEKHD